MKDNVHVLEWSSSSIKRVVKSTSSAEAYGVVDAAESAEWLVLVVAEIRSPLESVRELAYFRYLRQVAWFTERLVAQCLDQGLPKTGRQASTYLGCTVDADDERSCYILLGRYLVNVADVMRRCRAPLATRRRPPRPSSGRRRFTKGSNVARSLGLGVRAGLA